jgi:hypothetical protein
MEDGTGPTAKPDVATLPQEGERLSSSTMSKSKGKRGRAGQKKDKSETKREKNAKRDNQWTTEVDKENSLFEKYYMVSSRCLVNSQFSKQ